MIEFSIQNLTTVGFVFGTPGIGELVVIGVIAVLLFGSKLPEVARSLGSSYQQFRKGLSDIQTSIKNDMDIDTGSLGLPDYSDSHDDYDEPTAPNFEPPVEEAS